MFTGNYTHCKTLSSFSFQIYKDLRDAHGMGYHNNLDQILNVLNMVNKEDRVYKELGVMQGSSLAYTLINFPLKKAIGIDKNLSRFRPYEKLFDDYCEEKGVKLEMIEEDSLKKSTALECDVLHIDSFHKPHHLAKELKLHAPLTSVGIVMHDTNISGMYETVKKFLNENNEWQLLYHSTENVGTTSIIRK